MVEIEFQEKKKILNASEMKQGRMYELNGIYYICNKYKDIFAFSICGRYIVGETSEQYGYTEVDAVITIK